MGKFKKQSEVEDQESTRLVCVRLAPEILSFLDARIDALKDDVPSITRSDVVRAIILKAKREAEGGKKPKRSK